MDSFFKDAVVISCYTRQQAIEDGLLVDVTEVAETVGFSVHTVVTSLVWDECVAWSDDDSRRQVHQDESGRLRDLLWMGIKAARHQSELSVIFYEYLCVPRGGRGRMTRLKRLKLHIGPGDKGEAVITIMLPDED